ncbi:mammalian cell entry protein [Mycobacterium intermedium]|uniref:Mammalian cell entry protein n=1 Tax=Mycobacterium intermedium TaxID=28445 RepID=A0A1E3SK26_MYCIE|nr:virulence factor Mce family protein [Mycobacterium intermedium]MCV6967154.1 MCE family protein [Mycobacterium intermedium]ODR01983.1 mammalian cell entry protein [Mycobacterium intermedium]OPE49211.1 mammalian cell entry protein [Mycobacterium intermedium]ORA97053.1 mammalian cell entry protein [Mycobacterium intermedium]
MRTLTDFNRGRVGLIGITVLVLVVIVGQSFTSVPMMFASPSYYGEFTDSGQLNKGDKVRITGVDVGKVEALEIAGNHVLVRFSIGSNTIGTESRLAIKTDTILGKKVLEVTPRGNQTLRPGGVLALGQTATPYQLYDAAFDVTRAATGWNVDTVKLSLNVISQTIDETYPHLSAALDGLARFSDTIGKRDEQVKHLLAQANKVASVLGDRSEQINRLLVNAKTLLAAFNERGRAIDALLGNISAVSSQVQGFINDNPNLNFVLEQLHTLTDVLVEQRDDLAQTLSFAGQFAAGLGESVASGPYFKIVLSNLLPYWMLQPFVDAAFKKRGIDPEDFWRSAGLPAFRWPDPNGTRFPNGAPPPAPQVLEGTPDHPGPAVPPGTACSYVPAADALPRPWNPLPCAGVDVGPFGGSFPAPLDVQASPPNPNGLPPTPGIPIAGRPGAAPPDVPGTPAPLPPNAPPGARTENLQPAGPVPPPSTFAPGLPPGPPAPPGPGQQLPAPFITPGGVGGSGVTGGSQN